MALHNKEGRRQKCTARRSLPFPEKLGNIACCLLSTIVLAMASTGTLFGQSEVPGTSGDPVKLSTPPKKAGPELFIAVGRLYEESGKFAEAEEQYRAAMKIAPDDVRVLLGYAKLKDRTNEEQEAERYYRRAAAKYPNSTTVFNNMAGHYAHRGMMREATEAMEKAVRLSPREPRYRTNLAALLVASGRNEEAFGQLRAVYPEHIAHYDLGFLLNRQGDKPGAATQFAIALQISPDLLYAKQYLDRLASEGVVVNWQPKPRAIQVQQQAVQQQIAPPPLPQQQFVQTPLVVQPQLPQPPLGQQQVMQVQVAPPQAVPMEVAKQQAVQMQAIPPQLPQPQVARQQASPQQPPQTQVVQQQQNALQQPQAFLRQPDLQQPVLQQQSPTAPASHPLQNAPATLWNPAPMVLNTEGSNQKAAGRNTPSTNAFAADGGPQPGGTPQSLAAQRSSAERLPPVPQPNATSTVEEPRNALRPDYDGGRY
jgi:Tfp pilus assembly protein PilF